MKRQSLYFVAPHEVAVRETPLPAPASHQLLVQTIASAISPGTEMLLYRGQVPQDMPVDDTIAALAGAFRYPFKYGYAAVGRVLAIGDEAEPAGAIRPGSLVFAFNPHESHFLAEPDALLPLPDGMAPETAVFLPNMETAVSFLMDGRPMIGEQVAVFGQGIVGLLATALLAQYPLARLITLDQHPLRRQWSRRLGAQASLDPGTPNSLTELAELLQGNSPYDGADLALELSGNPAALDQAIEIMGYDGRILIGSWYGQKQANLHLGGRFHRSHIQIISSQVSHIAPRWRGRWTKPRRLQTTWQNLARHRPERLITHRFPITQAAQAYQLLDQHPEEAIQVILTYDHEP